MTKFSDWLVEAGILYPRPSGEQSTPSSPASSSDPPWLMRRVESVEQAMEPFFINPKPKVPTSMHATKVVFRRLHQFVETGAPFTPAQIAATTYKVLVGSAAAAQQSYSVPPSLVDGVALTTPVMVPFSALGFTPVPGVAYRVSVVASLNGTDSPVSQEVTFTNTLTPSAVDAVSVS